MMFTSQFVKSKSEKAFSDQLSIRISLLVLVWVYFLNYFCYLFGPASGQLNAGTTKNANNNNNNNS